MNKQILRSIIFGGLFLIPFIPFLVSSSFFFPFISTKAFAWRIIVELIFALWLFLICIDSDYRPKKSLISYAILVFLVVIGLADLFGVEPLKSFWSNFERMEGFITLIHLGMFFIVISSVFKEVDWKRWWNTSLLASFLMVLYCLSQLAGLKTINQGGVRVDGTLGNAIYLAVYMLFHIFIAMLFLWREWKNVFLRWLYGLLILLQIIILYFTATRGAILGLLGGFLIIALLNIRNKEDLLARKISIALITLLIIVVGGVVLLRNTNFVLHSPVLSRFTSLDTAAIKTQGRYFTWPMAVKGFEDRPILGWGQENFSYVFQKYYRPEMFRIEPWFDRAHNIFLDWAVAGGLLGLLSYLSLYVALLLSIWRKSVTLAYTEKSILTGVIAAYFFHNFFVFDHLISYIIFFSLLAYIHHIVGIETGWKNLWTKVQVKSMIFISISILLILSLYYVNIKPIITNTTLIQALQSVQTPDQTSQATNYFEKAYGGSYLGRSEVVEHMAANSITILTSNIPTEEKNNFFNFAKNAIVEEADKSAGDSRTQLIVGSFLSSTGFLDEALDHLNLAQKLIPNKQEIYFEIGAVYINKNERLKALETFKKSYDLDPENAQARIVYLIGAIYANDKEVENKMLHELTEKEVVFDDRIISAYNANKRTDMVIGLLNERIRLDPANAEKYKEYLKSVTQ